MSSLDARLRRMERALEAEPRDRELQDRYVRSLLRAGLSDDAVQVYLRCDRRPDAAGLLLKEGRRVEACQLYGIRWEAEVERLLAQTCRFTWGQRELTRGELSQLVNEDLECFDPERLATHFPRRADGRFKLNTSRVLKKYPAKELEDRHRRLFLIAWTPGTHSLWSRPEDRGRSEVVVGLETRSTRAQPLPRDHWRR